MWDAPFNSIYIYCDIHQMVFWSLYFFSVKCSEQRSTSKVTLKCEIDSYKLGPWGRKVVM